MTTQARPIAAGASSRGGAGLGFPVLLVAAGVYALLITFDAVAAPRWHELLALWPLLLVIAGVDILLARRAPVVGLALIATVITVALVAVSLRAAAAPQAETDRVLVAADGATTSALRLSFAGGRLAVIGGASDVAVVSSDLENVGSTVTRGPGHAAVELRRSEAGPSVTPTNWTVALSNDVIYDLDLDVAAGEFDVDLSSVRVTSASVDVAVGGLSLILPRASGDAHITVNGALTAITIAIPKGTAARVTSDGLIGAFGGGEFGGYSSATDRVTVTVKGAFASVHVRELP